MKKETKKAPTIRFRGFTDDWEQRKLGEIFTERSEKKHEYLPPLTIIQGCGTVRRDEMDRELIYDKSSLSNYKLVKKNDFIVHLRSFEGGLEKANIEGIVSPAYHIFHGEKINTEFYYSFFRSNDFINHKLVPFVYGIRDGRSIDIAGMKTIKIPYPSVNEQNRIGALIGKLNSLVALHQRKLDQLKKLKTYFLQNMLPAKGEKIPRIRFKGFTGDWEQRKLGDYVTIISGDAPSKFDEGNELYVKVDDLNCNSKYVIDSKNKVALHESINKAPEGSVVFPKRGAAIMTNKVRILADDCYIDTNLMALSSNKIDSEFLYNIISKEGLYKIADTSTIPQINNKHIEPYEVLLPRLDEQRTIGKFFKDVDNFITLHQRKLDQLQTMKKFMLQNLFI